MIEGLHERVIVKNPGHTYENLRLTAPRLWPSVTQGSIIALCVSHKTKICRPDRQLLLVRIKHT